MCDNGIRKTILCAKRKIQFPKFLQSNFILIDLRRYEIGKVLALHALGLDFDHQNSHKNARHASTHFFFNARTGVESNASVFLRLPSQLANLTSSRLVWHPNTPSKQTNKQTVDHIWSKISGAVLWICPDDHVCTYVHTCNSSHTVTVSCLLNSQRLAQMAKGIFFKCPDYRTVNGAPIYRRSTQGSPVVLGSFCNTI